MISGDQPAKDSLPREQGQFAQILSIRWLFRFFFAILTECM
jgi:hypothetical protein